MTTPAVSPDRGFDRSFDGDEQCFIFFLIQSWPPFPDGSMEFMNLSEVSGGIFKKISHDRLVRASAASHPDKIPSSIPL
jgi:hypothetical protein